MEIYDIAGGNSILGIHASVVLFLFYVLSYTNKKVLKLRNKGNLWLLYSFTSFLIVSCKLNIAKCAYSILAAFTQYYWPI